MSIRAEGDRVTTISHSTLAPHPGDAAFNSAGVRNDVPWLARKRSRNRVTGACPTVALHIPWDKTDDWAAARQEAEQLGVRIGAINPNLFQDDQYKLGSLTHPDTTIRQRAIEHVRECIAIAQATGSDIISLWLADGTNYPGQDDLRGRRRRLREALQTIYTDLPPAMRLLIEYKFFEPAFYSTDLPDWGTSLLLVPLCASLALTSPTASGPGTRRIAPDRSTLMFPPNASGLARNIAIIIRLVSVRSPPA